MDSLSQTRVLPNRLVSSWILTSHQPRWVTSVRIAEEIHNNNKQKTSTQRSGFKIWIFPVDFNLNLKTEEICEWRGAGLDVQNTVWYPSSPAADSLVCGMKRALHLRRSVIEEAAVAFSCNIWWCFSTPDPACRHSKNYFLSKMDK